MPSKRKMHVRPLFRYRGVIIAYKDATTSKKYNYIRVLKIFNFGPLFPDFRQSQKFLGTEKSMHSGQKFLLK